MRRHHQKDHVVDHILIAEAMAIVVLRHAELAEQIRAGVTAALSHSGTEKRFQLLARFQPSTPTAAGYRITNQRRTRLHALDKGSIDLIRLRPQLFAHEHFGGNIKR